MDWLTLLSNFMFEKKEEKKGRGERKKREVNYKQLQKSKTIQTNLGLTASQLIEHSIEC